jgi:cytochrome P450
MSRFERPKFDVDDLKGRCAEAQARLLFDWWCDPKDQAAYLQALRGKVQFLPSRAHYEEDPFPPRSQPPQQGHADVALISDPDDVAVALTDKRFSNVAYAELGGGSFMLALDPGAGAQQAGWHAEQRQVAQRVLGQYAEPQLEEAARRAVAQAEILSLRAPLFDLAEFAEQAALRYFGLVFGYSGADHVLLEDAARRGYRALQYVIIGRHFVSEAGTLPQAQQALARLAVRTATLMDEHVSLQRAPRRCYPPGATRPDATWPVGVQPWCDLQLSSLGAPALRTLPALAQRLSGQDLCNLVGGLLVGMVGNVQTSLCLMVQDLLGRSADLTELAKPGAVTRDVVNALLAKNPPVPFLPRRATEEVVLKGGKIPAGTECILALRTSGDTGCPWGEVRNAQAPHACVGRGFVEPLLRVLLERVLQLPELEQPLDHVTGEVLEPERLWGMGCARYALRHRRDRVRVQQPLIVVMPIKTPIAENAERLRRVIRSGAPRIQWLLRDSRMVHVAWFEFTDRDTHLALRTVYDGDFDSYIEHFALKAGELFDQLFECIEGAPPMPVSEFPHEFVETIRRYNRTPLGGFFYNAYPDKKVPDIVGGKPVTP